jgi:hypothetical protein
MKKPGYSLYFFPRAVSDMSHSGRKHEKVATHAVDLRLANGEFLNLIIPVHGERRSS